MPAKAAEPKKSRRVRRGRTWPQRLIILLGALVTLAAGTTAGLLALVQSSVSQIPRVSVGAVLSFPATDSQVRNFLLVGVDNAEGLNPDSPILTNRDAATLLTDTMLLIRLDPDAQRVSMLSIPRDLWVEIAGTSRSARINLARTYGGAEALIATINAHLGVPVHHYVEVNFSGFLQIVDAVGGVPLQIDQPIRDDRVGLLIEQPGLVTLDADTALKYVRTRRPLTLVDGEWVRLGVWSDLERNARQQDFIVAMLEEVADSGVRDVFTLRNVAQELLDSVILDEYLTLDDLWGFARDFAGFPAENVERYSLEVADALIEEQQVLLLQDEASQPTLEVFR